MVPDKTQAHARPIAAAAALLAEPARVAMLASLLDGSARPASELARIAGVTAPTASSHLHKLLDGGLLDVRRHGRHRYYALTDERVSQALEALAVAMPGPHQGRDGSVEDVRGELRPPAAQALRFARTCYRHLAGVLAVRLADTLECRQLTRSSAGVVTLTPAGHALLADAGILRREVGEALPGKACPDWTERRAHIAGPLGLALLEGFLRARWIAPRKESRAVRVTPLGEARFRELFGIHGADREDEGRS